MKSGRFSSNDPNVQNIPRDNGMRGCFIPRDGYYFCSIDYGQLELLCLAQVIKNKIPDKDPEYYTLLNAINAGVDVHCWFTWRRQDRGAAGAIPLS